VRAAIAALLREILFLACSEGREKPLDERPRRVMCDCVSLAIRARRYKRLLLEKRREFSSVTERGLWAGSVLTLMNARAAGPAGNAGRRTIRMNVPIQPELFAQIAGHEKYQETRLYLKKRNEHRLGAGRADPRDLADGIHHR
jgi:hypothetical protein